MRIGALLILLLLSWPAAAQEFTDTIRAASDTIRIVKGKRVYTAESYAKRFQPRKAILYAAVVPGMGQIYNKKYWKLPLVYGGFFVVTSAAIFYNNNYQKYKDELYLTLQSPPVAAPSGLSTDQLRTLTDAYRRQRDFFLILDGFMYILQMVDAHVDAHLREFDVNPKLRVQISPSMKQDYFTGSTSGVALTFTF